MAVRWLKESTDTNFKIEDDVLVEYHGSEKHVVIPNNVTRIRYWAFAGCSNLTYVKIPNSVTYIGDSAFKGCTGLTHIEIPNSVTYIDWDAFRYCRRLTRIEIPDSVTHIGKYAFDDCPNVTVYCSEGSYAEQYCIDNDINYEII